MDHQTLFNIVWGLLLLAFGYYIRSTAQAIKEIAADMKAFANEFRTSLQRVEDKREACQKDFLQSFATKQDLARVESDVSGLYDQYSELRVEVRDAKAYAEGLKEVLNK